MSGMMWNNKAAPHVNLDSRKHLLIDLNSNFNPPFDMYTSNSIYVYTSNNVTGTQIFMYNVISSTVHVVHKIVIGLYIS